MPTVDNAIALAKAGFFIFPLCRGSKKPFPGSRGFKDASNDEKVIGMKWRQDANIGISCGPSDIVVVDIDPKNNGDKTYAMLLETCGSDWLNGAPIARTPSGGYHIYFRQPLNYRIPRRIGIAPGIDLLGDGGYVVAPPSSLSNGSGYSWDKPLTSLPVFPRILEEQLAASSASPLRKAGRTSAKASGTKKPQFLGHEPWTEGIRNSNLASLAGSFMREGFPEGVISDALKTVNRLHCSPPLSDREVEGVAASIYAYDNGIGDRFRFLADWHRHGLTEPADIALVLALLEGADNDGEWAPPLQDLVRRSGLSPATLYRSRDRLIALGVLDIQERGSALSTIYRLKDVLIYSAPAF